jgi:hypothetical protein
LRAVHPVSPFERSETTEDDRKQVVEIVCHATGQLADAFHLQDSCSCQSAASARGSSAHASLIAFFSASRVLNTASAVIRS